MLYMYMYMHILKIMSHQKYDLKNNRAKFHADPIWNDGALGVLKSVAPNKNSKKNDKVSSDMESVPDQKILCQFLTQCR